MDLSDVGRAAGSGAILAHVATLIRKDIREGHRPALLGVAYCKECGSVGTIVEMGKCCLVDHFRRLGGIWDMGCERARWRTAKDRDSRHFSSRKKAA